MMRYIMERYETCERFNAQYREIYRFLLRAEKLGYNEHFHWGRFEWMHRHSYLDIDKLTSIVIFKDADGEIVSLITYDTSFDDRVYLIHTSEDADLLNAMVDTVLAGEERKAVIKVDAKDDALCAVLRKRQFERTHRDNTVLALDLCRDLEYHISDAYRISQPGSDVDDWQYQLVIHKGFDNEGIPEKWSDEVLEPTPNENADLKVFAVQGDGYCAHCGLWYTEGDTAYVSQMQALGVTLETIQSMVGHADVDMTAHYLHLQEPQRQAAVEKFSAAFSENPSGHNGHIGPNGTT